MIWMLSAHRWGLPALPWVWTPEMCFFFCSRQRMFRRGQKGWERGERERRIVLRCFEDFWDVFEMFWWLEGYVWICWVAKLPKLFGHFDHVWSPFFYEIREVMDWADRAQRLARAPSKRLLSEVWTGSRTKSGEWCQRCQHLWIDFSSPGRSWKYCYDDVSYIFIFTFLSQQSGAWNLALWSWSRVSFWIHSMKSWETWRSSGCSYITSRSGCFFHLSKSKMFDSIEYWGIWWRSEINFKTLPRWTLLEPGICILCSQSVIQNGRRCGIRRDFSICPTSQALGDVCNLGWKAPRHPFLGNPKDENKAVAQPHIFVSPAAEAWKQSRIITDPARLN